MITKVLVEGTRLKQERPLHGGVADVEKVLGHGGHVGGEGNPIELAARLEPTSEGATQLLHQDRAPDTDGFRIAVLVVKAPMHLDESRRRNVVIAKEQDEFSRRVAKRMVVCQRAPSAADPLVTDRDLPLVFVGTSCERAFVVVRVARIDDEHLVLIGGNRLLDQRAEEAA